MGDAMGELAVEHPLADEESALDRMSRLPSGAGEALAELGGWVQSLQTAPELGIVRKFEIVDLVDRASHDFVTLMLNEYLADSVGPRRAAESRSWTSATEFLQQLFAAYVDVLRDFQTFALGWGQIRDKSPLLVARALFVGGQRLKWQMLRYAPVDKEFWVGLTQLWSFAEDRGITGARIQVYEGVDSTVQREFLRSLMLAMSAADSLAPRDLDIAERIVDHFAQRFDLQRHPAKGCHFFIDLDAGTAPARYLPGTRVRPGVRFFGPGEAIAGLEELSAAIATEGSIPGELNLVGVSSIEQVIEVLGHLDRYWWARRPARTEERKRTLSRIAIVQGYERIIECLSQEGVADSPVEETGEVWRVENESEGGYGAVVPMDEAEWAKVGSVLGVRPADSRVWGVGIVRRLAAREDDQRYVGIQLLGRGARIVTLRRRGDAQAAMTTILLPSHVGESVAHGEVTLLLPAGGFSSQSVIAMRAYDRDYMLEPRMLLETGDDYDMAHYRIAQTAQ